MGIVIKQSVWNLVITGVGFVLGALNVLILATTYLEDIYYGLWGYVLSMSFLLFPFMSFGIHNTIVKYYSAYTLKVDKDRFLSQMLLWPVFAIIPVAIVLAVFQAEIGFFLSQRNAIVSGYLWHILIIAVFEAYFEIGYAWTKVHMKTIGGNFLKEVFYRAAATVALILLALKIIDQQDFIHSLVVIYAVRMIIMLVIAFKTYKPVISFHASAVQKDWIIYSLLMTIAGSVSTALLDLDKAMINNYKVLDEISYYNVAVFIAAVIAVPARGMAQITHPLTAGYLNSNDMPALENLYKRSSLNLSIISGFLLVIIICNLNEFYKMLPPEFAVAIPVVFFIAVVKYTDNLVGSNNAILYNSSLYKITVWLGLGLTIAAVVLNMWLIPALGIVGAAVATCVAYIGYSFIKVWYVHKALKVHPWTAQTWGSIVLILCSVLLFYFWDFSWHPVLNIALKSTLITAFYAITALKLNLSSEITAIVSKYVSWL